MKVYGYTDKELLEYMHEQGEKRFGSECKHEHVKKGYCTNCLRKVIMLVGKARTGKGLGRSKLFRGENE